MGPSCEKEGNEGNDDQKLAMGVVRAAGDELYHVHHHHNQEEQLHQSAAIAAYTWVASKELDVVAEEVFAPVDVDGSVGCVSFIAEAVRCWNNQYTYNKQDSKLKPTFFFI